MGPTAAGKTSVAVALKDRFPVDLISVDSALVYRRLDIGTAKPDAATLEEAPHRLINIRDPEQSYSAAEFRNDALAAMTEISAGQRIPLLVGGTMLYFRALSAGLDALPKASPLIRQQLDQQAAADGWSALYKELQQVDPDSAARIAPGDNQRIQRALEVFRLTGIPLSRQLGGQGVEKLPYRVLKIVVSPAQRSVLHQRITERFEAMLEAGFLAEVERLMQHPGLTGNSPSMRAVGYRQAWSHLSGETDFETFTRQSLSATTQLAKRQLTWLRAEPDTLWYDAINKSVKSLIFNEVRSFLESGA